MSRCESHAIGTRIVQEEAAHLLGDAATASDQFTGTVTVIPLRCFFCIHVMESMMALLFRRYQSALRTNDKKRGTTHPDVGVA